MKIGVKWYFPKNFEIDIFVRPGQNVLVTLTVCTVKGKRKIHWPAIFFRQINLENSWMQDPR